MEFSAFSWISEIVSFSLQSYCFFLFRGRKSLQLLLVVLCLRNVLSIATHTMPWPYFYQLYFGRIITALIALWAVGDVACYPATPRWTLRIPVAFAALLAIPYWPTNPANGPLELEQYRLFCLGCAMFIVGIHFVFLTIARRIAVLQLLLLIALAAEASGAILMLRIGYHPRVQMFYWWVGLAALSSFASTMKSAHFGRQSSAPALTGDHQCQSAGNVSESTAVAIRLPIQSRLPRSRVFERWAN